MDASQFLDHLKDVATSPYALIGYTLVVAAWAYVATAQRRLKVVARAIRELPEDDRATVLLKEYNVTPRAGLSAEQWIKSRRDTHLLI
jgi:hypothetical protein